MTKKPTKKSPTKPTPNAAIVESIAAIYRLNPRPPTARELLDNVGCSIVRVDGVDAPQAQDGGCWISLNPRYATLVRPGDLAGTEARRQSLICAVMFEAENLGHNAAKVDLDGIVAELEARVGLPIPPEAYEASYWATMLEISHELYAAA